MKWDAANERLLFLQILDTTAVTLDYKKIAETWPNPNEKPTARAVSEHIFKLRKLARAESARVNGGSSVVSTPKTPRTKAVTTPRSNGNARGSGGGSAPKSKRKINDVDISDSESEHIPANKLRVKKEDIDDLGPLPEETPSKRTRKPAQYLDMAAYADSGTEAEDNDKGSNRFSSVDPEYAPAADQDSFIIPDAYE